MSKRDESQVTREAAASEEVARELFEVAGRSESLADFLKTSNLPPIDELDDVSREQLGRGDEVEHTPIIITDGSVRIDLSDDEYTLVDSDYISTHLILARVESTVAAHPDTGSNICYRVNNPNEVCTVVFHCGPEGGGDNNKTVTIQGGQTVSPRIRFEHAEFPPVPTPPEKRKVHRGGLRRINNLEIFSTLNGQTRRVHVCPLAGDGCQYQIVDPHR